MASLLDHRYEIRKELKHIPGGILYQGWDTRKKIEVYLRKIIPGVQTHCSGEEKFGVQTHCSGEEKFGVQTHCSGDEKFGVQTHCSGDEKFLDFLRLLSNLEHPGLPRFTDFFRGKEPDTGETSYYIIISPYTGNSLKTLMKERNNKPLSLERVLDYFYQIIDIIIYLHSQSPPFICGTINPDQIIISDEKIIIEDPGINRVFNPQGEGIPRGYVCPEGIFGMEDPQSDIYAMGLVIYYMLTVRDFFAHPPVVMESVRSFNELGIVESRTVPRSATPPLKELRKDIPLWLDELTDSMLNIAPSHRPELNKIKEIIDEKYSEKVRPQDEESSSGDQPEIELSDFEKKLLSSILAKLDAQTLPMADNKEKSTRKNITPHPENPPHTLPRSRSLSLKKDQETPLADEKSILSPLSPHRTDVQSMKSLSLKSDESQNIVVAQGDGSSDKTLKTRYRDIFHALEKGAVEAIKEFILRGVDVNTRDEEWGWTPLHWSAEKGAEDLVEFLLDHQADIDIKDNYDRTPLHWASSQGNKGVARILIERGADLNAWDKYHTTPLHRSLQKGHDEITALLIEKGAELSIRDKDGWTPLHWALKEGNRKAARVLILRGADPDMKDSRGWTPLHLAVSQGYDELVDLLIEHGAEVNVRDQDGRTPLHESAYKGNHRMVQRFIEHGAQVNSRDREDRTPLHEAVRYGGHIQCARWLISSGADVNCRDKDRWTPLHLACYGGQREITQLLLSSGAEVNVRNQCDMTPLTLASSKGYKEIIIMLIDKEGDLSVKTNDNRTLLHWSVYHGDKELTELLLERGLDINARDNKDMTPAELARERGNTEIAHILNRNMPIWKRLWKK